MSAIQRFHCTNYCRKAIPCASDSKRYFFILYHIISLSIFVLSRLLFISWSSPPSSLFNLPGVQLYLKVPNHMHALKWYMIHWLIYFWFIECLYMHLFWPVHSRVTNRATNSSYTWVSFLNNIHAISFVFNFSREIPENW